jgi:methylenetetrahydrofolate dehydrogenase (NADP+)/methenyltetrahydrofolate cyclohydrolase
MPDRLSVLSRSDAVHGIRIKGWNLHRGEEDEWPYKYLEPRKDVECRTDLQVYAHLKGYPWLMIRPQIGAILKVLNSTLAGDYSNKTIAIVTGDQADDAVLLRSLAAILRNTRANIITCSPSNSEASRLVRSAHAVITAVGKPKYLNRDYVSEGQTIIDLRGWRDEDGDADLTDIEHVISFFVNRPGLFAIERRQPFVNMMKSFLSGRGNRGLQISRPLSRA